MVPDAGKLREISIDITVGITKKSTGHRRRRLFANKVANFTGDALTCFVIDIDSHAQSGPTQRAGLERHHRQWHEQTTDYLCATGNIDNRATFATYFFKKPHISIMVPGLA